MNYCSQIIRANFVGFRLLPSLFNYAAADERLSKGVRRAPAAKGVASIALEATKIKDASVEVPEGRAATVSLLFKQAASTTIRTRKKGLDLRLLTKTLSRTSDAQTQR